MFVEVSFKVYDSNEDVVENIEASYTFRYASFRKTLKKVLRIIEKDMWDLDRKCSSEDEHQLYLVSVQINAYMRNYKISAGPCVWNCEEDIEWNIIKEREYTINS